MKKEFQYLALGLFLVVIVALLFGSSGVEPYSKSDLFSNEYRYEGMEGDVEAPVDPEEKKKAEEAALAVPPVVEESMTLMGAKKDEEEPEVAPTIASLFSSDKPADEKKEGMFGLDQAYASVQNIFKLPKKEEEGFSLSPAEYGGMALNDKFSSFAEVGAPSQTGTCVSGGLSTSRGPLCLSPELMEILRTRGGNATGK